MEQHLPLTQLPLTLAWGHVPALVPDVTGAMSAADVVPMQDRGPVPAYHAFWPCPFAYPVLRYFHFEPVILQIWQGPRSYVFHNGTWYHHLIYKKDVHQYCGTALYSTSDANFIQSLRDLWFFLPTIGAVIPLSREIVTVSSIVDATQP